MIFYHQNQVMKLLSGLVLLFSGFFSVTGTQGDVVGSDDDSECLQHLSRFLYSDSSQIKEKCWSTVGAATREDGKLVLAGGKANSTGGLWAKPSISNAILQPNDEWTCILTFYISSPQDSSSISSAGLALWLTTKEAVMPEPKNRGVIENGFTGLAIVFESVAKNPELNEKPPDKHFRVNVSFGENLQQLSSPDDGVANITCVEKNYKWLPSRMFFLVIAKSGNDIKVVVNTGDEAVDCDAKFSVEKLTDLVVAKTLPPLYVGVTAWTGVGAPATIVFDQLASKILEAGQNPLQHEGSLGNHDEGVDHEDFKKSVVIGAVALMGVIVTIGIVVFIWICKVDLPCRRSTTTSNNHHHATPAPPPHQRYDHHHRRSHVDDGVNDQLISTRNIIAIANQPPRRYVAPARAFSLIIQSNSNSSPHHQANQPLS